MRHILSVAHFSETDIYLVVHLETRYWTLLDEDREDTEFQTLGFHSFR
jgi:hypothetical protein